MIFRNLACVGLVALASACSPVSSMELEYADQAAPVAAKCFSWPDGVVKNLASGTFDIEPLDGERNLKMDGGQVVTVNQDGTCVDHLQAVMGNKIPAGELAEQYIRDAESGELYVLQVTRYDKTSWTFMGGRYLSPSAAGVINREERT